MSLPTTTTTQHTFNPFAFVSNNLFPKCVRKTESCRRWLGRRVQTLIELEVTQDGVWRIPRTQTTDNKDIVVAARVPTSSIVEINDMAWCSMRYEVRTRSLPLPHVEMTDISVFFTEDGDLKPNVVRVLPVSDGEASAELERCSCPVCSNFASIPVLTVAGLLLFWITKSIWITVAVLIAYFAYVWSLVSQPWQRLRVETTQIRHSSPTNNNNNTTNSSSR